MGLKTNGKKTVLLRFTRDGNLDIHLQGKIWEDLLLLHVGIDGGI